MAKAEYNRTYGKRHKHRVYLANKKYRETHLGLYSKSSDEYYWRNRGKGLMMARKRMSDYKAQVYQHYSVDGKIACANCGINDMDVLCIDHIDGCGVLLRREHGGGTNLYRWIVKNNFPAGFQILCANCNLKKERERKRVMGRALDVLLEQYKLC